MSFSQSPIRVGIASDHTIFREGLCSLVEAEPDFQVVCEASKRREIIEQVGRRELDVFLLDAIVSNVGASEIMRLLPEGGKRVRTIVLVDIEDQPHIDTVEIVKLGAYGVLSKGTSKELLYKSIRAVAAGQYWLGNESISHLIESLRVSSTPEPGTRYSSEVPLTQRQHEILTSIVDGFSNREIAQKFSISEQTVKHHLTSIFEKVGVTNRVELALFAVHRHSRRQIHA